MPPLIFFSILGLILAIAGWGGLIAIIFYSIPLLGYRWLFFALLMIAVTGTFLPFMSFLNIRFSGKNPARMETIIRESILLGVFSDLLAWLQLGRVLSFQVGFYLFLGVIAIEMLIRVRENARWVPRK